jgi:hypothetical protein
VWYIQQSLKMAKHSFQLRASIRYAGEKNQIDDIRVDVFTDDGWTPLDLDLKTPGFLIFVYSFLMCQHTYFHANCNESGLQLDHADLDLLLMAGENWRIEKIVVEIAAELRRGDVDPDTVEFIKSRMRQCPVSINLQEPEEYRIEVEFS